MKNMNSARSVVWALVLAMPVWLGSCGSDDGGATPSANAIQGTWRNTGLKINPGVDFMKNGQLTTDLLAYYGSTAPNFITCFTTSKTTFAPDGVVLGMPGPACDPASAAATIQDRSTWKLDGNLLTIISSIGPTVYEVSKSGDVLRLVYKQQIDYDGNGTAEPYAMTTELIKE